MSRRIKSKGLHIFLKKENKNGRCSAAHSVFTGDIISTFSLITSTCATASSAMASVVTSASNDARLQYEDKLCRTAPNAVENVTT